MAVPASVSSPPAEVGPLYAVILAGGSGQRFWPLSRDRRPKQLLRLFDDRTLLEHTLERLDGLVPPRNILVLTNRQQIDAVRAVLPGLPPENIIAEPEKRDTAPAIALGIGWVAARDPDGLMMVLPSDHLIPDRRAFQATLRTACSAARSGEALVTIGIRPSWACPSYGYIERGSPWPGAGDGGVFEVRCFREKPDPETARRYLAQGNFAWNAGMFVWTARAARENLARFCPELAGFIDEVAAGTGIEAVIGERFASLPKISIDYALMEKAPRVLNVEAAFDWDDVGNWTSVGAHLPRDGGGNEHNCALSQVESTSNLVFSQTGQHVALVGVHDLVIVATEDALLVVPRSRAESLKKLVDLLPEELK